MRQKMTLDLLRTVDKESTLSVENALEFLQKADAAKEEAKYWNEQALAVLGEVIERLGIDTLELGHYGTAVKKRAISTSMPHNTLKMRLMERGVQPEVVNEAFEAAKTVTDKGYRFEVRRAKEKPDTQE